MRHKSRFRRLERLGDGWRNATARRYRRRHARRVLLNDNSAGGGPESGKDLDTSTPIDVLQQERGEEEIRARVERRMLDVVFENSSAETVPDEAFLQPGEKTRIQVGADYSEWAEDRRVQEVEHLACAGSHNRHASTGREFGGLN